MSKAIRGNQWINLADSTDCRCFGNPTASQHFFLQRNKSAKDGNLAPSNQNQKKASNLDSKHSISKKSLKKQKTVVYQNQRNEKCKNPYQEYYPPISSQNRVQRVELRRSPPPQLRQRSIQYKNVFSQNFVEIKPVQIRVPLVKPMITQIQSPSIYFNRPIVPQLPIGTIQINHPQVYSPQISPRIYVSAQKMVLQPMQNPPRYQVQSVMSSTIKPQQQGKVELKTKESIESQLTLKIPERKDIKQSKILSDRTIKSNASEMGYEYRQDDLFFGAGKKKPQQKIGFFKEEPIKPKFKQETFKQKLTAERAKLNIPSFQSKIDPKRSCIDDATGRSKITLKKVKHQKPKLKKIEDVEEIKSMNDSEQSRSDESIVLAKLNDYGSFVDPALSGVESCPTTFKSRLVYQSSTAERITVKGHQFTNYK